MDFRQSTNYRSCQIHQFFPHFLVYNEVGGKAKIMAYENEQCKTKWRYSDGRYIDWNIFGHSKVATSHSSHKFSKDKAKAYPTSSFILRKKRFTPVTVWEAGFILNNIERHTKNLESPINLRGHVHGCMLWYAGGTQSPTGRTSKTLHPEGPQSDSNQKPCEQTSMHRTLKIRQVAAEAY